MEAKELRIGNLVYKLLQNDKKIVWDIETNDISTIEYEEHNFKPIPLTEEWLLKFGFDKINESFYIIDFGMYGKKVADDIGYFFRATGFRLHIKYVHQLQNLYFALTGKELCL